MINTHCDTFLLLVAIVSILTACYWGVWGEMNGRDRQKIIKMQKWRQLEDDFQVCLEYLQKVYNYPTWRLACIFSTAATVMLTGLYVLLCDKTAERQFRRVGVFVITTFLVIFLTIDKIMSYFMWHIMCDGYGCQRDDFSRDEAASTRQSQIS